MPLSTAAFAETIKRTSDTAWIWLAIVSHPEIAGPLYLTTEPGGVTSNGQPYVYFPFTVIPPPDTDEGSPRMRVAFQNVDRTIGNAILAIKDQAEIAISVVTSLDHDVLEVDWAFRLLSNVQGDAVSISGDLILRNFAVEPYPGVTASQTRLPGLWR